MGSGGAIQDRGYMCGVGGGPCSGGSASAVRDCGGLGAQRRPTHTCCSVISLQV
jgi:hypothetical protein